MKTTDSNKVLVLGATGKTGSRVMAKLKQLNVDVRPGSRSAEIPFDWEVPESWRAALEGIDKVYISFQPDLAVPGALETVRAFTKLAVSKGVRRLVLLSGRDEPEAVASEEAVMNAGVEWTIVRASWFSQNFSEGHLLEPILAGHVALPRLDIPEPFIDADDIAAVVVAALTERGHEGKLYEVTGPELLSFRQAIERIASATNRGIVMEDISVKEYKEMLGAYGVPDEFVSLLDYLFTTVLDGRNASLSSGVQDALGREPKSFDEYVKRVSKTGIWNVPVAL